ncbi:MAG: hypothetical protein U0T82_10185 [Bacteroidales bacterium]
MKNRVTLVVMLAFISGGLLVSSCKKDDAVDVSKKDAISITLDDAVASDLSDDIINEAEEIVAAGESSDYTYTSSKSGALTNSRTITVDKPGEKTNFPKLITITYDNWTAANGRVKNGVVLISISERMWTAGSTRTITFENLTINGYKVEGTKTVTFKGLVAGKYTIEASLSGGKITSPEGDYSIERSFTHTRTLEEGATTVLNIWDDVWYISGTGQGKGRNGMSYKATITSPLMFRTTCPWISKGTVVVKIENSKNVVLDFGDGTCNRSFTITVDGSSSDQNSLE